MFPPIYTFAHGKKSLLRMRASLRITTRREMGHWMYPRVGPVFEYESLELQSIGQRLKPHTLCFRHLGGEEEKGKTSAELNRLKKRGAEMRTCHALLPHAQSAMQPKRMIFVGCVVIIHTFFFRLAVRVCR